MEIKLKIDTVKILMDDCRVSNGNFSNVYFENKTGLEYITRVSGSTISEGSDFIFKVKDQEKYFLAKIQYGI